MTEYNQEIEKLFDLNNTINYNNQIIDILRAFSLKYEWGSLDISDINYYNWNNVFTFKGTRFKIIAKWNPQYVIVYNVHMNKKLLFNILDRALKLKVFL